MLSPAFYEANRTGEIVSRLTADTTQIKSAFSTSASIALRNLVMLHRRRRHDGGDEPQAFGPRPARHPADRAAAHLLRPQGARAVAHRPGHARPFRRLRAGAPLGRDGGPVFRPGAPAAPRPSRRRPHIAFDAAAKRSRARAVPHRAIIFLSLGSVTAVLWYGAREVIAGHLTAGALSQFVLYAVLAASALGELSQVWGEIQLAAGAAERIAELLDEKPAIAAPAIPPLPCLRPPKARSPSIK